MYDRFLPFLVSNSGGGIIDIGANIGDTAILVKSKTNCKIICVEPDNYFLSILEKNISLNNLTDIEIFPHPISNQSKSVSIVKNQLSSTANISEDKDGELVTYSIKQLIEILKVDINQYPVLKIDTDGFDWDVLKSLVEYYETIGNSKFKFIFFEFQFYLNNLGFHDPEMDWRINEFIIALNKLKTFDYNILYVFDNFGTHMFSTDDIDIVKKLANYIILSQTKNNSPTIWFCDILICNDSNKNAVEKALFEYSENDIVATED